MITFRRLVPPHCSCSLSSSVYLGRTHLLTPTSSHYPSLKLASVHLAPAPSKQVCPIQPNSSSSFLTQPQSWMWFRLWWEFIVISTVGSQRRWQSLAGFRQRTWQSGCNGCWWRWCCERLYTTLLQNQQRQVESSCFILRRQGYQAGGHSWIQQWVGWQEPLWLCGVEHYWAGGLSRGGHLGFWQGKGGRIWLGWGLWMGGKHFPIRRRGRDCQCSCSGCSYVHPFKWWRSV